MLKCPNCNMNNDPEARYCANCGFSLMETMLLDNFSTSISKIDDLLKKGGFLGDRYIILESLATGGMGHVFRAKDTTLDEIVVLKILKADLALEKDMLSRFKREIKVARKVKHPNVCTIYDFGNFDDIFFISMEYIHGTDLSDLIEENKVQRERILPYARGILNALGAAHSEKIIHRDLKPSNIKIDNQDKPVILDFGIARYIGIPDLTGHEEILGTPAYMSPEQFKGEKIDQRTDIYAFGIILYEMYVGHIPFSGASPIEVAMKHLQEPPVPLRTIDPTINPELEAIVLKCMRKDPDERYQNVDEILADLDRLDTHDTGATETQSKVRPATVLIADDDEDIRKLLNTILLNNGYGTLIAQSGEQAIDLAINNKPDLICMDLMMPGMDGYQAVEFLQANPQTRGIPIVMITCKQDKEYRAYGKSIGVKEYITKPFDINKLLNNIKKIVPPTTSRP